jgi:hypothetical protein
MEQLPEVLPTVDPALGALVLTELAGHGVEVLTGAAVRQISKAGDDHSGRLYVEADGVDGQDLTRFADLALVVTGVRPDTRLAVAAGAQLGAGTAVGAGLSRHRVHPSPASAGRRSAASSPPPFPEGPSMGHLEAAMITDLNQGLRAVDAKPLVKVAEARGFEPRMGVNPNRISSAAP